MRGRRFKLVLEDRQGDRRHTEELYQAPSLEEIQEFLGTKAPEDDRERERDGGDWGW